MTLREHLVTILVSFAIAIAVSACASWTPAAASVAPVADAHP